MIDDKQPKNEKPGDLDEAALEDVSGGLPHSSISKDHSNRRYARSSGTQTEDDLYVG